MTSAVPPEKRRTGAAIRVPFVKRCRAEFTGGRSDETFVVNINTLGAYIAADVMPPLGWPVELRFTLPNSEREFAARGVVAWTNPRQEHPVHSLPPGFGLAFHPLEGEARSMIERIVSDYVARMSG